MEQILSDLSALVVPFAKNFICALLVLIIGFKVVGVITKRIKNGTKFKNTGVYGVGWRATVDGWNRV